MGGVGDGLVEGGVDFDPFTDPDAGPLVEVETGFGAGGVDESGDFAGGESCGAGEADEEHGVFGAVAFHGVEDFEGVGEACGEGGFHVFVDPVAEGIGDVDGVGFIADDFLGFFDEFGVVALDEEAGFEPFLYGGFGDGDMGGVVAFEGKFFAGEGVGFVGGVAGVVVFVGGVGLAFVVEEEVVGEGAGDAEGDGFACAGFFDGLFDKGGVGDAGVVGVVDVLGDFFGFEAHGDDAGEAFFEGLAVFGHVADAGESHGGEGGFGFVDLGEDTAEDFFFLSKDGDGAFDFFGEHGLEKAEGYGVADFGIIGD